MAKTSVNVKAAGGGSESHNEREKQLNYTKEELTKHNESLKLESISKRLETIKNKYEQHVGQKMQKKATPIREGVVVIKEDTTMEQLQDFTEKCKERFGIDAFQIHIHKDEGHEKDGKWKSNLHAHIVWDWTDPDTGKSRKLDKHDMSEMQTILAESLEMERGASSDRKHLDALQWKNYKEEERLQELISQAEKIQAQIKSLELSQKVKKTAHNALKNVFEGMGLSKAEKELKKAKNDIETLKNDNQELLRANKTLNGEKELMRMEHGSAMRKVEADKKHHMERAQLGERYKQAYASIQREAAALFEKINPEMQKTFIEKFPKLFPESLMNKEQKRGRGR